MIPCHIPPIPPAWRAPRCGGYDRHVSTPAYNTVVILGPTASGKTAVAAHVAAALNGEVVSADSRQVYRELDVGAGKDREAYRVNGRYVPVHLIDVTSLEREYSVFDYQRDCYRVLDDLLAGNTLPVVAGGTGLYIEAVLDGYELAAVPEDAALRQELNELSNEELEAKLRRLKPQLHNTTDFGDRERTIRAIEIATYANELPASTRPNIIPLIIGLRWPRSELRDRIHKRLRERLDQGMITEVEALLAQGVPRERLLSLGLEYRYVTEYLDGLINNQNDLKQKLAAAIIRFAKRQDTWFRRMERRGHDIHWVEDADPRNVLDLLKRRGFA